MKTTLLAGLIASALVPSAFASITYNDTITYINGSGNPNTGWVAGRDNGILLGIRADNRTTGATPNDGAGTYTFQPGNVGSPARADWNYQFTLNSDPTSGATKLSTYNFWLSMTKNGNPVFTAFNLMTLPDNTYGNNGTVQGTGTVGPGALAASFNVAANSESITFLGDPNTGGVYFFDMWATLASDPLGAAGTRQDEVSMTVVVPEAQTYWAGALLLLPFGWSAFRKLRKASAG